MTRRALGAVLATALTVSCAVGPDYKRPPVAVPDSFYAQAQAAEARSLADAPWWELFGDDVLKALIEEALRNGYDARLAVARVEEARARHGIARSEYFPQVGYGVDAARERPSEFVNPGAAGESGSVYSANVNVAWEIDLWGRIRRLNEAALASYLATEEARRGVYLFLVSDVARAYFELLELDEELAISRRTAEAFQETFELFNRRLEGGAASALETARAQAARDDTRANIPDLERLIVAKENEINLLVGRPPQPIPRGARLDGQTLAPEVPGGLPSALLERRPDVREAEQLLRAANAAIGVAQSNYFPRISLTGLLGGVSDDVSEVFGTGKTWSIGASLFGPLFQGGRIKRTKELAIAQHDQARVEYERAVTASFADVSTTLIAREKLVLVEQELTGSVGAYREAVRLASLRYESGLSSYFEVLDAMLQLFPAELRLARARRDRLTSVVDVYRALGGGWQIEGEP